MVELYNDFFFKKTVKNHSISKVTLIDYSAFFSRAKETFETFLKCIFSMTFSIFDREQHMRSSTEYYALRA